MPTSTVTSSTDSVTKEEALAERKAAGEPLASRYRASVSNVEAESRRLIDLLKQRIRQSKDRRAIRVRLKALESELWPQALLECYGQARRAEDRLQLVISAIFEARESATARQLGLAALNDRSYGVRERAVQILAYSLDRAVLPALRDALNSEQHEEVSASLEAAIKAIEKQNHHLYIDRQERGNSWWGVNPWDSGDPPVQRGKLCYEIEKIREAWQTDI